MTRVLLALILLTVFGGVVGYDATELYDNAVLVVDGGSVGATYGLILNGSSRADLHSSDRVDPFAYFITRDTALLQIFGADFRLDDSPVGPGDLSGVSGVLAGTLESGDALSVEVGVAATATLRLVPEPGAGAAMLAVLLALWGVGALRRRAA